MASIGETEKISDEPSELKETTEGEAESKDRTKKEPALKNDVETALEAMGHKTCVYPNGMILGVKLDGIKGKRGVHVDIVHVLDWRQDMFSGSLLAMQSAALETVNRPLLSVLADIGLADMQAMKTKRTTRGTIEYSTLMAHENHSGSQIHETRTVYVVTKDIRPSVDLSWLTSSSRIVGIDQFALARQSDSRSVLPEVGRRVDTEKWDHLEKSISFSWFSVILFIFGIIGLLTYFNIIIIANGNQLLPIAAMIAGGIGGFSTFIISRREMGIFQDLTNEETSALRRVGDGERISKSMQDNAEMFQKLKDLSFVVSPLMASMGGSIRISDMKGAVYSASSVIDEIVRHSDDNVPVESTDEGLSKFLGLFVSLDSKYDDDSLSLCYVGLSNYIISPISDSEVILHCTTLLNALGRIGVVRPEVKAAIDEKIDQQSMTMTFVELQEEINRDDGEEDKMVEMMNSDSRIEQEHMSTASSLEELQTTRAEFDHEMEGSVPLIIAGTAGDDDIDEVESEPTASDIVKKTRKERAEVKDIDDQVQSEDVSELEEE